MIGTDIWDVNSLGINIKLEVELQRRALGTLAAHLYVTYIYNGGVPLE